MFRTLLLLSLLATGLLTRSSRAEPPPPASQGGGVAKAILNTGQIVVRVGGFRNAQGSVYVALWRNGTGFPGKPPANTASQVVKIVSGSAVARFAHVSPGSFAITVFHDEDGDTELRTNFIGIPREGIGFSRGVRVRFGPPDYEDAELVLAAGELKTVKITLQYL